VTSEQVVVNVGGGMDVTAGGTPEGGRTVSGGNRVPGGGTRGGNRDIGGTGICGGSEGLPGGMKVGRPGMGMRGRPDKFGAEATPGIGIAEMPGCGPRNERPGTAAGARGKPVVGGND